MLKIIGLSFCVLLCNLFLKEENRLFSSIISIAGGIIIFLIVSTRLSQVFNSIFGLGEELSSVNTYIKLMIKVLCMIVISQFSVDICRDNGENALASLVELAIKIIVLSMVLPLFETVLSLVIGLVK